MFNVVDGAFLVLVDLLGVFHFSLLFGRLKLTSLEAKGRHWVQLLVAV